jgi:hypothetical protein
MAGDWIKVECSTPDKPEVIGIADRLGLLPQHALGSLFMVWRWFDQHTENGNARCVTTLTVDRLSGVTGFAQAMIDVGWLVVNDDGTLTLPGFCRHNGKTAKTRANTANRVAKFKKSTGGFDGIGNANGNAEVTPGALPREEKRRIVNPLPSSLRSEGASPGNQEKVGKATTFRVWLQQIKASGETAITGYKPVFEYCDSVGIPESWLQLAWYEFRDRYLEDEKAKRKKYVEWRRVFLRSVKEGWFGLWYFRDGESAGLTTKGQQAQAANAERLAA